MVVQAGCKAKSRLTATTLEGPGVPVYLFMLLKIFHTAEDLIACVAQKVNPGLLISLNDFVLLFL